MTLDEAIKHCEDVAEDRYGCAEDCVNEHRQLAEWLKELKAYRVADTPQTEQRNRSTAEFITGTQIGDPQPLPNGITTWASSSDEPQTDCPWK